MAENKGYSKNIELIAHHDLNGLSASQFGIQKVNGTYYLYASRMGGSGWHILNITDPANPKYIRYMEGPKDAMTAKIQVADGKMIASVQGTDPHAAASTEGCLIYDVKTDPENPKLLSHWATGARAGQTHRSYYSGGRYVHLSASAKGFAGISIYRILDIIDPEHPVEVGRWWRPEQWLPGYTQEERKKIENPEASFDFRRTQSPIANCAHGGLHGPPYVKGNLVYSGWNSAGMLIHDISDITEPQLVGQLQFHPPFSGGLCGCLCHTVMPLSQRDYAIVMSEGERFPLFTPAIMKKWPVPPMPIFGIVDTSDPTNPTLISTFPYPEVPKDFPYKNFNDCGVGAIAPFGPHNLHEPHGHPDLEDRNDRIYICYFHAGVRVYDISDPYVPKEIAYYIPPNPEKWIMGEFELSQDDPKFTLAAWPRGPKLATVEDMLVDNRGFMFVNAYQDGLYVLRCTV